LRAALIVLGYLAAAVVAGLAVARLLHWADTPDTKAPTMSSKRRRRRPYGGMGAALIASLAPASFPAVATRVTTHRSLTAIQDYLIDDGCSERSYRERSGLAHSGVRMHGRRSISTSQKESTMNKVGDVLAVAIEALEEFLPSVTDSDLTRRIQRVMVSLERLQREIDERVH
jgi:hypothetical protein